MATEAKIFSEANPTHRVDFEQIKFTSIIQDKGLRVNWKKMSVCPCKKEATSQAVVDCINCGGTGFYFFGEQTIKAMVSGAQMQKNFMMWTEILSGSIIVTVDPIYKVGWYDKLTVLDAETVFSEICLVKILDEDTGIKTIRPRYEPTEIISAFSYLSADEALRVIDLTKMVYANGLITIDDDVLEEGESVSLVYNYNPTYLIIDLLNDYRNTYVKNKLPEEVLKLMPIKVLAKKMHLVLV